MKNTLMTVIVTAMLITGAAFAAPVTLKPDTNRAVVGGHTLQNDMRDPDSFVIERVIYTNNGKDKERYCYEYRARNGFGGMERSVAFFEMKYKNDDVKVGTLHFSNNSDENPIFRVKAQQSGCDAVLWKNSKQNITGDVLMQMKPVAKN